MSQGITIGSRFISWEEIPSAKGTTEQEKETLSFLQDWFSDTAVFSLKTSGSTGTASTITVTREQIELSASRTINYFNLDETDHALVAMNVKYIAGKMMLVRALIGKMKVTVLEPERLPDLDRDSFSFTAITPLQLQEIIAKNGWKILSPYKCILVGGAPVPVLLRNQLANYPLNIYETYGMTETVSHIAVRRLGGPGAQDDFTCIHEVDLETDDLDRLRIRGTITNNTWLQTNDRVILHGRNAFEWLGRSDWVINSGGIKIQPEKIEEIIEGIFNQHGWKNRLFLHAWPHHEYGEVAILIIEGSLPATEIEIKEMLLRVIDRYEIPKKIVSIPEFIRTETGKVRRKESAALLSPLTF